MLSRNRDRAERSAPTAGGGAIRPGESSPASARRPPRGLAVLIAAGLFLAALNLRPAISGLGPLLEEIRQALGMSPTVAGLLTSAPALCFAIFGATTPRLARRYGPVAVLLGGLTAITAGIALRPLAPNTSVFLATSALALGGIAVSNVLMPVIVKRYFPDRVGVMTGLYSMALSLGTASAAALTVPLSQAMGGGWRLGLAMWAVVASLALVPWAIVAVRHREDRRQSPAATHPGSAGGEAPPQVLRSPTAWSLALFFALQATAAYVIIGWLPQIFRDAGVPASTAGWLLAVAMGMGVPLAFVLPRLAARLTHQGPLIAVLSLCGLTGYAGLWFAPAAGAWAWAVLLGVSNCAFPVALTLIGLRSRTSTGVARLSAFVQSTGYLLAIPGPLLVGTLYGATDGWRAPLILLSLLVLAQSAVGIIAGRNRVIEDDSPPAPRPEPSVRD